jgi:hypothetical protein
LARRSTVVMRVASRAPERTATASSSLGGTMRASSTMLLLAQKQSSQFQLPLWLSDLFNIVRRGRDVEGLFRLSCSSKEREALVHRIDDGDWLLDVPGAPPLDVHVCANTLKHFLARTARACRARRSASASCCEASKATAATRFVLLRAAIGCSARAESAADAAAHVAAVRSGGERGESHDSGESVDRVRAVARVAAQNDGLGRGRQRGARRAYALLITRGRRCIAPTSLSRRSTTMTMTTAQFRLRRRCRDLPPLCRPHRRPSRERRRRRRQLVDGNRQPLWQHRRL